MAYFHVQWEIDIEADTPEEAARQAWAHMRRHDSTANAFMVWREGADEGISVDLSELDQAQPDPTMAMHNALEELLDNRNRDYLDRDDREMIADALGGTLEIDCGQCEGTGETDAMGHAEECPVCDGSGKIERGLS